MAIKLINRGKTNLDLLNSQDETSIEQIRLFVVDAFETVERIGILSYSSLKLVNSFMTNNERKEEELTFISANK